MALKKETLGEGNLFSICLPLRCHGEGKKREEECRATRKSEEKGRRRRDAASIISPAVGEGGRKESTFPALVGRKEKTHKTPSLIGRGKKKGGA